ncbi:MAG: hypothetical protein DRP22_04455 [Verrucomicrobia bacterium]|nr:MAG: hypothetical protein DRP22_04455 [Verrucomicrobiota bacterium]
MHHLRIGGIELELSPPSGHIIVEKNAIYAQFWDYDGVPCDNHLSAAVRLADRLPFPVSESVPVSGAWRYWCDGHTRAALFMARAGKRERIAVILPASGNEIQVLVFPDAMPSPRNPGIPNPLHFPVDMVVWSMLLPFRQGLVMHAAGWLHGGEVVVLAGPGGAGKSTLAGLLQSEIGGTILSDDRMILRMSPDGLLAWGTPWSGDRNMAVNRAAPVRQILFLHKDRRNRMSTMTRSRVVESLLKVSTIPWYDQQLSSRALQLVEEISRVAECRSLGFVAGESAATFVAGSGLD